jgi:hypothetical protein
MEECTAKTIVKVYSVLSWIAGIGSILFGIFILLFDSKYMGNTLVTSITGIILIIIGVLIILLGKGLWNFKSWARIISVILLSINSLISLFLLIGVISLIGKPNAIINIGLIISPILSLLINGAFLYFLAFNKTVIALFK